MTQLWIGRFAPSPSGPLHFGSLVAALGSYLVAKHHAGQWLLRIEDIDPPRVVKGAASQILQTLEAFGLCWDGSVVYQSQQSEKYLAAIEELKANNLVYACDCSRSQLQRRNNGIYDGFCRDRGLLQNQQINQALALRIRFPDQYASFHDQILGDCNFNQPTDTQDFIIRRRDQLFAYQLAVVVDDIEQGVNHVVRGADILDSTPRQNFLYDCFAKKAPTYFHLPLVVDQQSHKLSKSKLSPSIQPQQASQLLIKALMHLNQNVSTDLQHLMPAEILQQAVKNWDVSLVGTVAKVMLK